MFLSDATLDKYIKEIARTKSNHQSPFHEQEVISDIVHLQELLTEQVLKIPEYNSLSETEQFKLRIDTARDILDLNKTCQHKTYLQTIKEVQNYSTQKNLPFDKAAQALLQIEKSYCFDLDSDDLIE